MLVSASGEDASWGLGSICLGGNQRSLESTPPSGLLRFHSDGFQSPGDPVSPAGLGVTFRRQRSSPSTRDLTWLPILTRWLWREV